MNLYENELLGIRLVFLKKSFVELLKKIGVLNKLQLEEELKTKHFQKIDILKNINVEINFLMKKFSKPKFKKELYNLTNTYFREPLDK